MTPFFFLPLLPYSCMTHLLICREKERLWRDTSAKGQIETRFDWWLLGLTSGPAESPYSPKAPWSRELRSRSRVTLGYWCVFRNQCRGPSIEKATRASIKQWLEEDWVMMGEDDLLWRGSRGWMCTVVSWICDVRASAVFLESDIRFLVCNFLCFCFFFSLFLLFFFRWGEVRWEAWKNGLVFTAV